MLELWISIISITDWWIALIEEWISIKGLSFLPFHGTVGLLSSDLVALMSWGPFHQHSTTNCPKNLSSDGLIVREMGPWPECIFRSLLQFLVYINLELNSAHHYPDSKVHGANMGPTWVLSAPCWPHEPCYQGRCLQPTFMPPSMIYFLSVNCVTWVTVAANQKGINKCNVFYHWLR